MKRPNKKKALKIDSKYMANFEAAYARRWVELCKLTECDPLDSATDVLGAIKSRLSVRDDKA